MLEATCATATRLVNNLILTTTCKQQQKAFSRHRLLYSSCQPQRNNQPKLNVLLTEANVIKIIISFIVIAACTISDAVVEGAGQQYPTEPAEHTPSNVWGTFRDTPMLHNNGTHLI
eukprot:PhM_4_TR672/c0_g1_i2/m.78896